MPAPAGVIRAAPQRGWLRSPACPLPPTAGLPTAGLPTAGLPTAGLPTAGSPTAGPAVIKGPAMPGLTGIWVGSYHIGWIYSHSVFRAGSLFRFLYIRVSGPVRGLGLMARVVLPSRPGMDAFCVSRFGTRICLEGPRSLGVGLFVGVCIAYEHDDRSCARAYCGGAII
jgi:hypothetical protein